MVQDKRRARRQPITHEAAISDSAGRLICSCTLHDISKTGGRLKLAAGPRELPSQFVLVLSRGGGVRRKCQQVWRDGDLVGVRFL